MYLWEQIKQQMQTNINREIYENKAKMTFEEMIVFAELFAEKLKGIKCCAIMCESEMAAGMALLSCFAAQVTALPLSQRYGRIHCNNILNAISPDALITDANGEFQITYITDSQYIQPALHPALIMCTSGTTGTPKGVMLTEDNIIANVKDILKYFEIGNKDAILITRPLYHCAVLTGEFLSALFKGTNIRFYSGGFNPIVISKLVKQYKISVLGTTPTLLNALTRLQKENELQSLKHICVSGECLNREIAKNICNSFPTAKIYHVYGLTEACPRVAYLPPRLFENYAEYVGFPLKSVEIKIVTEDGKLAEKNQVGVLWVKGPNVMLGYYNEPTKTAQVLQDGWLCTGDFAVLNETGLLKIKGRSDDLIIKSGMNIYPIEVETALRSDSRVKELYVYGDTDEKFGTQIVLNIVGDFNNEREVRDLCKSVLPKFQIPSKINLLSYIEKNGSGKILRRKNCD